MSATTVHADRPRQRGDGLRALLYLAPGMSGFVLFIVLPLLASLVISFYSWSLTSDPEAVGR